MAKIIKRKKPINKDCLHLANAILAEDTKEAKKVLKKIVKTNISQKLRKAEKETDLF